MNVATMTNAQQLSSLGSRFKEYRLAIDMTQEQLAAEAGVSRNAVIRFESGQVVNSDTLLRILSVFGFDAGLIKLIPRADVRPIERVKNRGLERVRARPAKFKKPSSTWKWGDEK